MPCSRQDRHAIPTWQPSSPTVSSSVLAKPRRTATANVRAEITAPAAASLMLVGDTAFEPVTSSAQGLPCRVRRPVLRSRESTDVHPWALIAHLVVMQSWSSKVLTRTHGLKPVTSVFGAQVRRRIIDVLRSEGARELSSFLVAGWGLGLAPLVECRDAQRPDISVRSPRSLRLPCRVVCRCVRCRSGSFR